MEVGSQTDPMDPQDILNQLRQKSLEKGEGIKASTQMAEGDQDEIHSVPIGVVDGEVFFNSHNEPEFRRNSHPSRKSTSSRSKSHPVEPSLTDKICEAVWGRKDSIRVGGSTKSKKLARSQSFKGSSSTSSNLSPTKNLMVDPYARRASGSVTGCSSYIRSTPCSTSYNSNSTKNNGNGKDFYSQSQSPSTSPKFDPTRVRRSVGDVDIRRQISSTLNIPSRQDSVKSCSSKSTSGQQSPIIIASCSRIQPMHYTTTGCSSSNSNNNNNNNLSGHQIYRLSQGQVSSSRSLVHTPSVRGSRSNSISPSSMIELGGNPHHHHSNDLPMKERKHRRYVIMGFTFLLLVAIFVVVMSLSISSHIDARVRKENENLMRVIQQTTSTSNNSTLNQSLSSTLSPLPPIGIEDQDENNNNYNSNSNAMSNSNSNNNNNLNPGQSLTSSVITVDPGQEEMERIGKSLKETSDVDVDRGGGDEDESRPLSSSLIGAIFIKNLNSDIPNMKNLDKEQNQQQQQVQNSPTEFKAENADILLGQISDIDEVDRARTSIVLR